MFNNLNDTKIVEASEEDLLAAIGDAADDERGKGKSKGSKGDDDGAEGDDKTKGKNQKALSKSSGKDKSATTKTVSVLSKDDLVAALGEGDDDDDQDDNEDDIDDEEEGKSSKKSSKKASKKEEKQDDDDDENEEEDDDDDENEEEDDDDDENEEEDDDENPEGELNVSNFLKARVDFLIKKGEWVDWEGREDIEEWDEDAFAEMEIKQREYQRAEMREQILDEFGPIGREIAKYAANGGNPQDLIDIFKEQKVVENLNIETEDQQKAVVLKYVTEYLDFKPERANKYVNSLIADKELEEVAKEAKEKMEKALKDEAKELQEAQQEAIRQRAAKTRENLQKFANDVVTIVNSRNDIDDSEKKELLKVLTKFDKKLKDGTPVNEFYFKLAEFRKSLPNYIDMVRFVMNPKKFVKSAENRGKTSEAEKAFRIVRTDNKKKAAKSADVTDKGGKAGKKTTGFKLL